MPVKVPKVTADVPPFLREQMAAAREAGFYDSEADLVTDAVRTLLAARPDLRLATACRMYARGSVSVSRGAELAGVDIVRFKRALHEGGIPRTAHETAAETAEMARASLRAAGRRP